MAPRSVIIIGAGISGLSAGCYAQMNGYRSHIFEHHTQPGGVAATWKRGDYTIDGGIHFPMGYKPGKPTYDLYRELGILPHVEVVEMTSYAKFIDEEQGCEVHVTPDLDALAGQLKSISPADARLIDDLVAAARAMSASGATDMDMSTAPDLIGLLGRVRQMWKMRGALRYFGGKFGQSVADYARDAQSPCVRRILENLFLPQVPVWFIAMILAMLHEHQLGLLVNGCLEFARAMEKRYKDLGGEISYQSTVARILTENDVAVGVRLADGREHRADAIVSAADGHSTLFEMLDGRYVDRKTHDRYETWQIFRPTVTVSFGVARDFAGEPACGIMLDRPITIAGQSINGLWVRFLNYGPFAPPGRGIAQLMIETEWDYWNDLHQDPVRYDAEKQRVASEVLDRLETHYPGISSAVEVIDVATPYTTWRYTRNFRGSPEGWLPTTKTIMANIPRRLPGLARFYMAGQWVMPGGGVPPCLYSGRHAVQILCHDDRRPFVATAS